MEGRPTDVARVDLDAELERLLAGDVRPRDGARRDERSDADALERLDALILAGLVSP